MRRASLAFSIATTLAILAAACSSSSPSPTSTPAAGVTRQPTASATSQPTTAAASMTLTSSGFAEGAPIPPGYSCDGHDISPPLAWSAVPPGTSAFALIMEDPHATSGTFVHWVLYDLPPYSQLPPGIAPDAKIGVQGVNSAGKPGYTGPCPPRGSTHHYRFRIFALDAPTGLPAGATAADVRLAIQGHTLATATLTATFGH